MTGGVPANSFMRSRLAAQTRVSPYCPASVTASLEGEALLARIGIPARIALTAAGIDDAFMQVYVLPQGEADCFVHGVVPSNVFALKKQAVSLCQKAAVSGPGFLVERHAVGKAVCQRKHLGGVPGDGGNWADGLLALEPAV